MKRSNDGKTHLNIYSKAQTELGRFLSNFSHCPIITEDGPFDSIEGYWYWLGSKDDKLRTLSGYAAKSYGRSIGAPDWQDSDEFKRKICAALEKKLLTPKAMNVIFDNWNLIKLPFVHYYVYNNKIVQPKEGKWVIKKIESFLKEKYKEI